MKKPSVPPSSPNKAPWKRVCVSFGAVLVLLIAAGFYRSASSHGAFTAIPANSAGKCSFFKNMIGVDDIAIDAKDGIAFLAVTDHRALRAGAKTQKSGIYAYAYKKSYAQPVKLAGGSKLYHPHALALSRDSSGALTLQALSYGPNAARAVISYAVTITDGAPVLKETALAQSGLLVSPHAIATVGSGNYYVTNDHMVKSDAGRWIDDHFVLPRSNILYFDGSKFTVAAQKLNFPSGVAVSEDGRYVYVAERYARKLITFERDPFRGRLKQVDAMQLPANPDRMTLAADGSLWLAASPKPAMVAAQKQGIAHKAPSLVWRVDLKDGIPTMLDQVFADDGHRLSGAMIAAEAAGKLLIGSGYDAKLAVCATR